MKYPSVTQILKAYVDFSDIRDDVLDHASRRGTAIHQAVYGWATSLWTPPLPPAWEPYYQSFLKWAPFVEQVIDAEFEIVDDTFKYCGHPDLVVVIRGDRYPALLDIKTPATSSKLWRLQTSAYRKAAKYDIKRHGVLHLKADGRIAKMLDYTETYEHDLSIFLQARAVHGFLKEAT